jgi:hypothetical protein
MLRWLVRGAAGLVGLAALALVALLWLVDTPALRAWVGQVAGQAVGHPVRFASISVRPLPLPTIHLRGVEVAADPAFGPPRLISGA